MIYYICFFIFVGIFVTIIHLMESSEKNVFKHIYLINLKRRPDRFDEFMVVYNNTDFKNNSLTRVNAIDGGKLDIKSIPLTNIAKLELKQLETTGFRYKHYQLTRGAIGCYLSHVKIWEKIVKENQDKALIFEDDARPPPNIVYSINKIMMDIPNDWDIILLGKHCHDCEDHGSYLKIKRFILLHSYIISKRGVEKIIGTNSLFPISQQLDAYLSEISSMINIYSPKTDLVLQGRSRTDIQAPIIKSDKNNDRMLLNKL
jgi:GR25 family glycosyltransferase involved in LPS biosynthesis|uniref:Glycosyl transferase family 25 domain-containing protein n=1 Tax=viral metagenome TaxID=1070528 RepID=A0A6C0BPW7_9ZZZZ